MVFYDSLQELQLPREVLYKWHARSNEKYVDSPVTGFPVSSLVANGPTSICL